MAAGQVICSFFPVVFEKLNGLIKEGHLGPFWSVEEELNNVFMDFCKTKDVLTDAEQKQFMDGEAAVLFWLKRLNEAAYEADDVLDELQVKALQVASEEMGSPEEMNFRQNIQEDIKKLSKTFRKIAEEIKELGLQKGNVEKGMEEICPGREPTSPLAMEPHPYGRDEDREELLKLLLKDDYRPLHLFWTGHPRAQTGRPMGCSAIEKISNCSIVGIGGIGKTTLAQVVYNDPRVAKYFASRFWVCVSNVFDAERIVKEIVPSSDSSEKLEDGLKKLSSTRFLLVLDDVWEENQEKWNKFKAFFRAGVGEGSSIIVTTRLQTVANITRTVEPLCIKGLSEEDCLHLFKKYAFGPGNEERPALGEIGKEIVKKCGGLPLAVKALGSLLRHKNEENEWLSIKDSAIWELHPSDVNNILPSLMLSYSHLPPLLKQCFVYCSIFPQDYEIEKDDLIQQWMAHSLVQGKELEDVGNEIFNALLRLSFFQDAGKDTISYKVHDRMHDLATYIAGDAYSVGGEERSRKIGKITRHVSLLYGFRVSSPSILESIQRASPCLRSLIVDHGPFSEFSFQYLHRLRALDLQNSNIEVVPDCIDEMIHLRYINLSGTDIRSLPKSICLLRNLQTLKLQCCSRLEALPNDTSKMSSLRHLDIKGCRLLKSMPDGFGKLSGLRGLNCFIVSSKGEYGMSWLHKLNPGAELEIKGLEHVISSTEAKAPNLVEKKNIRSLSLEWSLMEEDTQQQQHQSQNATEEETEDEDSQQPQQQHQEVIDGLQPHAKLRELFVKGYQGPNSPSWLTPSCVPNLVKISLSYCRRCERLSPLGKLGSLKVLNLENMDSLKFIVMDDDDDDARIFRSLEGLRLWSMPDLEGRSSSSKFRISRCNVPVQLKSLTTLTELTIKYCGNLVSLAEGAGGLRNLSSLKTLHIDGCNALKHLPQLHKTSLVDLAISNCPQMEFSTDDFEHLVVLERLKLSRLPKLKFFPEGIKHTAAKLRTLIFNPCSESGAMDLPDWISTLTSLKFLSISVTKNWKMLPQWLQEFTALQDLSIYGCDEELERQWKKKDKERGDDCFNMISHVPRVRISSNVWSGGYY